MFMCDPDFLNWFPSAYSLMDITDDASLLTRWKEMAAHLVLPLFCWTYPSLAYLSRQMRGGMLEVLGQDYIQTARAKGLGEFKVIWKHAFKNAVIPVITLFAGVFPLAISGSIVIELIFSIPGMGKVSLDALLQRDYPVVYTMVMFTAIFTLVGTLVSDILYALVNPRIRFGKG
jgi:peptide/nickel transport system permease protein